jgi:hypothetical protein
LQNWNVFDEVAARPADTERPSGFGSTARTKNIVVNLKRVKK